MNMQPARSRTSQFFQYNPQTKSEGVILSTTHYSTFHFDEKNRPVNMAKVQSLTEAIQNNNLLDHFPIVVSSDMGIIDGQHRLLAAQNLGVPIYYIISDRMKIEDAALANANTTGWKPPDYLRHWVMMGNPEYLKLQAFYERYPWLSLAIAYRLCYRGDANSISGDFQRGAYVANNIPSATRVCEMALDFKQYVPFWKDSAFLNALRNLDLNPDYNHNQMMQKMVYLSAKLVKCPDMSMYMPIFSSIYNYRVPDDRRVELRLIPSNSRRRRKDPA